MADSTEPSTDAHRGGTEPGALEVTGVYETDSGIVFYDSEEPLAWVQADNAVTLQEMT